MLLILLCKNNKAITLMVATVWAQSNGSYTMTTKSIKTLEPHHPMGQLFYTILYFDCFPCRYSVWTLKITALTLVSAWKAHQWNSVLFHSVFSTLNKDKKDIELVSIAIIKNSEPYNRQIMHFMWQTYCIVVLDDIIHFSVCVYFVQKLWEGKNSVILSLMQL